MYYFCKHVYVAWINMNSVGDYNAPHNHPNSFLSGVFYLAGGAERENSLVFTDPRSGFADHGAFNPSFSSTPGTLLLFPSWLTHLVLPHFPPESSASPPSRMYCSHEDDCTTPPHRISFAFNLHLSKR